MCSIEVFKEKNMAIVRDPLLINPEAIPAQTAYDLAHMIYSITSEELAEIFNEAGSSYNAPNQSWLWSAAYYLFALRSRGQDFLDANALIENRKTSLTESAAFAPVKKIFDKEDGTWYEGSANTLLMKALLNHLKGYDHEVQLSARQLKQLCKLLDSCITKRIQLNHQLKEIENQIRILHADLAEKEREMIEPHKHRIKVIPTLDFSADKRREWIKAENERLKTNDALLKPLRDQADALSIQRAKVLSQLVELNPALNHSRIMLEEDELYSEANRVAKIAYDAAMREYIVRVKDQRVRNNELTLLASTAPKLDERKAMAAMNKVLPGASVNLSVVRAKEAKEVCAESGAVTDDLFKSRLTTLMQSMCGNKPLPPKEVVIVEPSQLMRERQATLNAAGLFGAVPPKSEKSETSYSPSL